MPSRYNLEPWPWQPELCPADEEFIQWLLEHKRDAFHGPIFHMGTGLHHRVGRTCYALDVECVGLTASEGEEIAKPELPGYRVILEDIYQLDASKLPTFQYMTLFHLGELVDWFGEIQVEKVNDLIRRVEKSGMVFFYKGSSAWDRVVPFLESNPFLKFTGEYKDLKIYRRWME